MTLDIELDLQQDGHVDLLLPIVPCPRAIFEKEYSLGYDERWPRPTPIGVRFPPRPRRSTCPRREITHAIQAYLKMAEVIAERNPTTGKYCGLTGSWEYSNVWSTPNAMTYALLLDPAGTPRTGRAIPGNFQEWPGPPGSAGKGLQTSPGLSWHAQGVSGQSTGSRTTARCSGRFPSTRCSPGMPSSSKSTRRPSSNRASGSAMRGG